MPALEPILKTAILNLRSGRLDHVVDLARVEDVHVLEEVADVLAVAVRAQLVEGGDPIRET